MLDALLRKPWLFAICAALAYAAACVAAPSLHGFDPSRYIHAGDRFVDPARTASPLRVKQGSDGYDGQFYYRLALRPWSSAPVLDGVAFDDPAYRMQRIGYPAIAWAASLGNPALVPAALLAVNLAGIFAMAALAAMLCAAAGLPRQAALAILLWPGFVVALTHDTTEIASTAFLLAAILARVRGRALLYGLLAAAAMLTRETTAPLVAGLLLWDFAARTEGRRSRVTAGAGAVLAFAAWRGTLLYVWRDAAPGGAGLGNLGPPFAGAVGALARVFDPARTFGPSPAKDAAMRAIVLATSLGILAVCALVCARLRPAFRARGATPALAAAWCIVAALMSLLTAAGPWVDTVACTRAFTECYVVGCLVVAGSGWTTRRPGAAWAAGAAMLAAVWLVCLAQLRAA